MSFIRETRCMRRLLTLVVVAIVASSCAQTVNVDQEKASLLAADAEWAKVAKDPDKFVSYFAPDGTFGMGGMPELKGPAAIKAAIGQLSQAPGFNLTWKATRADVAASGDLAFYSDGDPNAPALYRFRLSEPSPRP